MIHGFSSAFFFLTSFHALVTVGKIPRSSAVTTQEKKKKRRKISINFFFFTGVEKLKHPIYYR